MARYDLLAKGGTLIAPAQGTHASGDIAFAGGLVPAGAADIPPNQARQRLTRQIIKGRRRIYAPGPPRPAPPVHTNR